MKIINNQLDYTNSEEIVSWSEMYATGIKRMDMQHRELVSLTNELYQACLNGNVEAGFKEIMSRMVEYIRLHFTEEPKILQQIKYPKYPEHKKQHETLIKNVLEAVKEYHDGKKFIPNTFVRTLKDWVFSHIAFSDREYAAFIMEQKKKGLLSDLDIEKLCS